MRLFFNIFLVSYLSVFLVACSTTGYFPDTLREIDVTKLMKIEYPHNVFIKIDGFNVGSYSSIYLKPGKHSFSYTTKETKIIGSYSSARITAIYFREVTILYKGYFIGEAGKSYSAHYIRNRLTEIEKVAEW